MLLNDLQRSLYSQEDKMSAYAQQQREVSSSAYFYSYPMGITLMISNTSYTNVDKNFAGTLQGYGNHTIHFSDYFKLL